MSDYVRDHLPEIIIILAVLVIFWREIRKKLLSYAILTNSEVLPGTDKENIQLLYKGQAVPKARLVKIRIKNSGNLAIEPSDFIERLSLRLPNSRILSTEVSDPHSLGVLIETERSNASEIVLSKIHLEPKDFFDIKILLADENADLSLRGRVKGGAKIQSITGLESSYYILLSLVAVNLLALIARFLGWLDRSFLIILQIVTLLVGVWMSLDLGSQDVKDK